MSVSDVFQRITAALTNASVPYMVSGSFASSYYGTSRSTRDIDLVVDATSAQLHALCKELPADKYAALESLRRQSLCNVIDLSSGWKIDLIFLKSRPYDQGAFQRRQRVRLHEVDLSIVAIEDSIISKLEWAKMGQSLRQLEDVATILQTESQSLDRPYLDKWIAELGLEKEWSDARRLAGISELI